MFFVSLSRDVNEYILHAHGLPLTRDLIYKFNYARSPVGGGGLSVAVFHDLQIWRDKAVLSQKERVGSAFLFLFILPCACHPHLLLYHEFRQEEVRAKKASKHLLLRTPSPLPSTFFVC